MLIHEAAPLGSERVNVFTRTVQAGRATGEWPFATFCHHVLAIGPRLPTLSPTADAKARAHPGALNTTDPQVPTQVRSAILGGRCSASAGGLSGSYPLAS
jgi:hypothetical protein